MTKRLKLIAECLQNGNTEEARAACTDFLEVSPDHPIALHLMGAVAKASGDDNAAIEWWHRAAEKGNGSAELQNDLGAALMRQGRSSEAISYFRRAAELAPSSYAMAINLARALLTEKRYVEAEGMGLRALGLRPKSIDAKRVIADALRGQGRFAAALDVVLEVIKLGPKRPELAMSGAAALYDSMGQLAEATKWHREAARASSNPALHSNYLFSLRYLAEDSNPAGVFREHCTWATRAASLLYDSMPPPCNVAEPKRRLRIGYLSADMRHHSASNGIEALVHQHNRKDWEVWCYFDSNKSDEVTARFKESADHWREVSGLDDQRVAQMIRDDAIDILVDHTGHMGGNRMLVFARRPAPVQVSFPGYPGTTGLRTIDAFFTDAHQDPPGQTEKYYSERLIRFEGSPRCYRPIAGAPRPGALPADANEGQFTFGVVQRPSKLTDRMFAVWSRILRTVPKSRLLLLLGESSQADLARTFRQRLVEHGIETSRVALLGRRSIEAYLQVFQNIDVALDTQPYAGCTTTMDALWMGVPVVTMAGRTYVARVGVSILAQLGLEKELVAENDEQYVEIARRLAGNLPRLRELRATLRQRMMESPLLDAKRVVGEFEEACRGLWREWCSKQQASITAAQ